MCLCTDLFAVFDTTEAVVLLLYSISKNKHIRTTRPLISLLGSL